MSDERKIPTTTEEVDSTVREWVEEVGHKLAADEDWMPVLFLFGCKPDNDMRIAGLPQLGDYKEAFCRQILPELIRDAKPDFAALVIMGWTVQYDPTTLEGRAQQARDEATYEPGNIQDRPNRIECLTVMTNSAIGDEHFSLAKVIRGEGNPPRLEWEVMSKEHQKHKMQGRFVNSMRFGFKP